MNFRTGAFPYNSHPRLLSGELCSHREGFGVRVVWEIIGAKERHTLSPFQPLRRWCERVQDGQEDRLVKLAALRGRALQHDDVGFALGFGKGDIEQHAAD
jgi:hypothetical protein